MIRKTMFSIIAVLIASMPNMAQDNDMSYRDLEDRQDDIEALYIDVFDILETYPEVTYTYVYEDGEVVDVDIEGMIAPKDANRLSLYLIDLKNTQQEIFAAANRMGIYYATETSPEPMMNNTAFYNYIHDNLDYPEIAEDAGVTGTVFVKFVVDEAGDITYATTSEKIDANSTRVINAMKSAAVDAVKATSGKWKPAEIAGVPVPHYVVLPVQYELDDPITRSMVF